MGAELEPSCPERDILAPLTLSTSRIPTVTPSPPESVTFSSLARATSLTSHFPRARVSSSPSPRKETETWQNLNCICLYICGNKCNIEIKVPDEKKKKKKTPIKKKKKKKKKKS